MAGTARSSCSTSEIVPYEISMKDEITSKNMGLLESVGSAVFSLARHAVEKLEKLPYPIGSSVNLVEELVSPKMISASTLAETMALQALAYADEQVEWMMNMMEKCLQFLKEMTDASKQAFNKMISLAKNRVQGNSLVDYAANLLVNYEIIVKHQTDSVLHLVLSFSGLTWGDNRRIIVDKPPPVIVLEEKMPLENPPRKSELITTSASIKEVHEISPVKPSNNKASKKPRFDLAKAVASFNNEADDEADELSKLIDESWCLGSPRHV